jgi:hypothetical protein
VCGTVPQSYASFFGVQVQSQLAVFLVLFFHALSLSLELLLFALNSYLSLKLLDTTPNSHLSLYFSRIGVYVHRVSCSPSSERPKHCQYNYKFGDFHLDQSCRLKPLLSQSVAEPNTRKCVCESDCVVGFCRYSANCEQALQPFGPENGYVCVCVCVNVGV